MSLWPFHKANGHANGTPLPAPDPLPVPEPPLPPPPTLPVPAVVAEDTSESRLSLEAKRKVCEWLGQYRTVYEVLDLLKEQFKTVVTYQAIQNYANPKCKWAPLVQKARAAFLASIQDIPIAQKTVRLDRYERLYQRAMKLHKDHDARLALFGAQKEMEGVHGDTTVYVHQQILQMDTHELEQRRRDIAVKLANLGGGDAILEARTVVRGDGAESAEEEAG